MGTAPNGPAISGPHLQAQREEDNLRRLNMDDMIGHDLGWCLQRLQGMVAIQHGNAFGAGKIGNGFFWVEKKLHLFGQSTWNF